MPTVYRPACRSFVRRARPFRMGQEAEYQRLARVYRLPFDTNQGSPNFVAGIAGRVVILEIGFGDGDATWQMAQRNPDVTYLGVDVYRTGILRLMRACHQREISNVRVVEGDAIPLLNFGLPACSVQGVHLFFPDPWPKKRHRQRRLLQEASLDLLAEKLTEAGYVYFVTDWRDYARQVAVAVNSHPRWKLLPLSLRPWRPQTSFERKGLDQGHHIFELLLGLS